MVSKTKTPNYKRLQTQEWYTNVSFYIRRKNNGNWILFVDTFFWRFIRKEERACCTKRKTRNAKKSGSSCANFYRNIFEFLRT